MDRGEFVEILGHSGCGKSTIMNILAGLTQTTSGVVTMDGGESSGPSLDRGVVFQNYAQLPWLTALGNVRNHLVQFLGRRSAELAGQAPGGAAQRPDPVRIDLTEPVPAHLRAIAE
ncbi:MAG: ATP-binding cassette domain-containing protein [Paracoccus sp. (in: a-proteobacteria)]|uniref:ATP-binding cassette domain-containing protein n=1 Tax=Paracoccus sp. TaxID=267 RepID=UPI0032D982A5